MTRHAASLAATIAVVVAACAGSTASPAPGTPGTPATVPSTATHASTPQPTAVIAQATPTPFGNGPWIAYQANGANGYGVQLLPLDGGHGRSGTVAGLGGYQEHPDWAPDGRRFVFTIKHDDSSGELWIADPRRAKLTRSSSA